MGAVTWDIMKGMTFRSEFGFEITLKNNAVSGVWRLVKLVATITSRWRNGA